MTRSIFLAAALALAACSHGGTGGTTPPVAERVPELPLVSLVDPSSPGVVHLDLARIHDSTIVQTASAWVDLVRERRPAGSDLRFVLELLEARELVTFISPGTDHEPMAVLLLRGDFDEESVSKFDPDPDQPPQTYQRGPFTLRRLGSDGSIARFGDHTLVLGRSPDVDAVVDRQLAGGNGHYPEGEAFVALANRVGLSTQPFAFVVVPTPAMREAASSESDPFFSAVSAARGVGIGLDPTSGLRGTVVIDLDSNLEAVGLATLARMQLGNIGNDPDVRASGLSGLLPHLQIDRDGTSVVGRLDAPQQAVDESIRTLDRYVRGQIDGN